MSFYSWDAAETFFVQYMIYTRDEHARAERAESALREALATAEVTTAAAKENFYIAIACYKDARAHAARERGVSGESPENPIIIE
jgi:hypothetical protein